MTYARLRELRDAFTTVDLVVEVDRWSSDLQMIHEHYYNILYGYYNEAAKRELQRFVQRPDIVRHIKPPSQMVWPGEHFTYKVGDVNGDYAQCRSNLEALLSCRFTQINVIDLEMWSRCHANDSLQGTDS